MLYVFAGGHRMGSTFQCQIGINALKQVGAPFQLTDNSALNVFHLEKIRNSFAVADSQPDEFFVAKAHPAFPSQVEAVLTAKNSRVFLVWRDHTDALVSDFHFSQQRGGHVYKNFDDYFSRRGRRVLIRNCLQRRVWGGIDDDRVRAWNYLDLVENFESAAAEMVEFAELKNVDIQALKRSVSIEQLRKIHKDPKGTFFREGGKHDILRLEPSQQTIVAIENAISEPSIEQLKKEFEKEDWLKTALFGRECQEAGARKTFHWWLYDTRRAQHMREKVLPIVYKFSPRRLIDGRWTK